MSITFNIRHLDMDWFSDDAVHGVFKNTVAETQNMRWWVPFNFNTGFMVSPTFVVDTSAHWEAWYSSGNAFISVGADPGFFYWFDDPNGTSSTCLDSNWTTHSWDLSTQANFTSQLCTFFAANINVAYPGTTSLNLVMFRGVIPGQSGARSAVYCYFGNDPNFHEQIVV